MPLLRLTFLLIYTFGAVAFTALLVLSYGERRKQRDKCGNGLQAAILFASALWFWLTLVVTFQEIFREPVQIWRWYAILIALACVFPPMFMRLFYVEERPHLPPSRYWGVVIRGAEILALILIALNIALWAGWPSTDPVSVMRSLSLALVFLFSAAGVLALIVKRTARQAHIRNGRERQQHKWSIGPAALTIALISVIALSLYEEKSYPRVTALASRALPLAFILVGTYSRSRFEFFDAFVKQGVYFLLALVLLTALFAGLVPVVQQLELGWARPWVYAVAMLPIVFASPWVYRQLGMWLDRVWLGRRFTTVQAIKYFLSEVREATNEQSLVERANKCLSTVMQAPARIILGQNRPEAEFDIELRIPIPSRGEPIGCILMGKRSSDEPFFGEDIALLSSLADVFHSLLDTIRLQIKKREQEKREQDLMIEASRSELKALRAQINPHFLFNALNAIAGLIERDPVRAEETVERLAEVFRYVLRRSENEWACLKDELEFIQAYLEIEQARFGKHLQVSLEVDPATRELRIPAMIIQTVVENAVKHGVSSTRGLGLVRVRASQSDQILKIEVLDNGPGFKFEEDSQSRQMETGRGYGLKNVRQRLQGYFGEAGKLTVGRDKETGQTCVSISIPVLQREFEQVAYDSSANRR